MCERSDPNCYCNVNTCISDLTPESYLDLCNCSFACQCCHGNGQFLQKNTGIACITCTLRKLASFAISQEIHLCASLSFISSTSGVTLEGTPAQWFWEGTKATLVHVAICI